MAISICLGLIMAAFFTSVLSGVLGMAGGMVLMGILTNYLPVAAAMVAHGIIQLAANGSRAFYFRKDVYWPGFLYFCLGFSMAIAVGLSCSFVPSKGQIYLGLGLAPLLALSLPKRWKLDFTKPSHGIFCGFSVSLIQLISGVAGPILDLFFIRTELNKDAVMGTKAMTQTLSHSSKILYYGFTAQDLLRADADRSYYALLLCSPLIACLGTYFGKRINSGLSEARYRKISSVVIVIIGFYYLAKSIEIS